MEKLQEWWSLIWNYMNESRLVAGLLIFAAFGLLAWLVDLIIDRVLFSLARRSKFHLDDEILEIVHKPIWISFLFVGALIGVGWISPQPPFHFIFEAALKSALIFLWLLTINRTMVRIAKDWIRHWRAAQREGSEIISLGMNIARVVLIAGAIFLLLTVWKINITPLLASAGIVGVAVALAAKETLSNFFGGVSVLLDQPYKVGDYIVLDSGERGEVTMVGLRSTRIITRDDVQISIPNSVITNAKIINESAPEPRFRVRIKIGVAYGTDVDKVEELLLTLTGENELVSPQPNPRVRFRRFGDSSLDFELLCWARRPHDKGRLIHQLNRSIYKALNEAGIKIPFPQREVHIYSKNNNSESS
jgi:small-conductance mechanosensitive channel